MPSDNDYKVIAMDCAYHIDELKKLRKTPITSSKRLDIKEKVHTLMIARWTASKRFAMTSDKLNKELKRYYKGTKVKVVQELYFLKHYRYDFSDLVKYKEQFMEEVGYEIKRV